MKGSTHAQEAIETSESDSDTSESQEKELLRLRDQVKELTENLEEERRLRAEEERDAKETMSRLVSENEDLRAQLATLSSDLNEADQQLQELVDGDEALEEHVELKKELYAIQKENTSLQSRIDALEEQLEETDMVYISSPVDFKWDGIRWAYNNLAASIGEVLSVADIAYPDAYIRHKGQGHLIPLPGQAQNVFIPRTVLGVNASGKQQDRALSFVDLLLSQQIQQNDFGDGMPVNAEVFSMAQEDPYQPYDDGMYLATSYTDGENVDVTMEMAVRWPSEAFMKETAAMLEGLDTPSPSNAVIEQMLTDETKDYFAGKKSLDETVGSLAQKLNLYLSE